MKKTAKFSSSWLQPVTEVGRKSFRLLIEKAHFANYCPPMTLIVWLDIESRELENPFFWPGKCWDLKRQKIWSSLSATFIDSETEIYKSLKHSTGKTQSRLSVDSWVLGVGFLGCCLFGCFFFSIHTVIFSLWNMQNYYFPIQSMTQTINISNHNNTPAWLKASWITWIICMEILIIANDSFNKEAWKPSINSCSILLILMLN